jgi:hypothetical protein
MDSEIDQIIQDILNDNVPTISGGAVSGGKRSRKRRTPKQLASHHKKVMDIFYQLDAKNEKKPVSKQIPRNKLLTQAMKRSKKASRRRSRR